VLEREILPAWLPRRRWFAAKTEALRAARLLYAVPLTQGERLLLAEVETAPGTGWALPLAQLPEEDAHKPAGQLALARLRQGARVGLLTDATAIEAFPRAVFAALQEGRRIMTASGEIRFQPTPALATLHLPVAPEIRRMGAEQSNTSLIIGGTVVLKLLRRIEPGVHPEAETARHLTAAGYTGAPALLGEVVRCGADGTPHMVMLLHAYAPNQGDAWGWTLDWLARTVDEAALTEADPDAPLEGYRPLAEAIGRRLAQLHLVLARPSADPAFAPEVADPATARVLGLMGEFAAGPAPAPIPAPTPTPAPSPAPVISGTPGEDWLAGTAGADTLEGGAGSDDLQGLSGDDLLRGGRDHDGLTGGVGRDVFAFARGDGPDWVVDFTPGEDRLQLEGITAGDISQRTEPRWEYQGLVLDLGQGDEIYLQGITRPLTSADIVFG
jgi:hypothetical protein